MIIIRWAVVRLVRVVKRPAVRYYAPIAPRADGYTPVNGRC